MLLLWAHLNKGYTLGWTILHIRRSLARDRRALALQINPAIGGLLVLAQSVNTPVDLRSLQHVNKNRILKMLRRSLAGFS